MGFSHALIEIVGKEKLREFKLGAVSCGSACAIYFHQAINSEYDMKYWYFNSMREFFEKENRKYYGFVTSGPLIRK
jgi:hypothetical protein